MARDVLTLQDHREFLEDWARRHGCTLQLEGEVGFGRPCVGMAVGNDLIGWGVIMGTIGIVRAWRGDGD